MSRTQSLSALAAGLGILALACWFVTATFPLAAAPQMIADGPGVTVDAGGSVLHRASVAYPDSARARRIQGVVTVEATVDSSGNVLDTRVLGGPTELRRAAQQSVLQWHFATDSSAATRQVKINFDLGALPEITPPQAADLPGDAAHRAAMRSQVTDQAPQAQNPATRRQAMPKGSELQTRINEAQGRLARISTGGLTDAARVDLIPRLGLHVGDPMTADAIDRVRRIVREYDEHINVGITLDTNGDIGLTLTLPGNPSGALGGILGSVPSTASATEPKPNVPPRITIGGNVQQAKLVVQPKPMYPPLAKQARISGVVQFAAVIGKEGNVIDLQVVSGHPLLVPAALEAVRNWVYQKTLLNGEPVEVSTRIDVNFTLTEDIQ